MRVDAIGVAALNLACARWPRRPAWGASLARVRHSPLPVHFYPCPLPDQELEKIEGVDVERAADVLVSGKLRGVRFGSDLREALMDCGLDLRVGHSFPAIEGGG